MRPVELPPMLSWRLFYGGLLWCLNGWKLCREPDQRITCCLPRWANSLPPTLLCGSRSSTRAWYLALFLSYSSSILFSHGPLLVSSNIITCLPDSICSINVLRKFLHQITYPSIIMIFPNFSRITFSNPIIYAINTCNIDCFNTDHAREHTKHLVLKPTTITTMTEQYSK